MTQSPAPAAPSGNPTDQLVMAGIIGGELARHTQVMDETLRGFQSQRFITREQMRTLRRAVAATRSVSLRSQQIARLAGGRLRQSHERLHLGQVVEEVLRERDELLHEAGVVVDHHLREVEIIVDPGLLVCLVESAVDWAAREGQRLQVWLEMKNWPEHALLTLKSDAAVQTAADGDGDSDDNTAWLLLLQVAHTMGVSVDRFSTSGQTVVQLEFPRTVRQLEGLTAIEVDGGGHSSSHSSYNSLHSEPRPLAGHRVLLITGDEALKSDVARICEISGMAIDTTPTMRQAVRFCELDMPQIILLDERVRDELFDELRQDILRQDLNFPFIEIAQGNNVFEMSSWMGDAMSRVSRDALAQQLASVMAMELAKVI